MNLPNISRFGNALILAFEPKTRNFIMGKQLARSKIASKFFNYLALFVRVFHPSLFACKKPFFLLAKHCNPSILIDLRAQVFSTIDRLGFTVPTYVVGEMVIIYYRQVFLPLGFAWLCERWYRILLIGCLHLSLRCDTWFTISYANTLVSSDDY